MPRDKHVLKRDQAVFGLSDRPSVARGPQSPQHHEGFCFSFSTSTLIASSCSSDSCCFILAVASLTSLPLPTPPPAIIPRLVKMKLSRNVSHADERRLRDETRERLRSFSKLWPVVAARDNLAVGTRSVGAGASRDASAGASAGAPAGASAGAAFGAVAGAGGTHSRCGAFMMLLAAERRHSVTAHIFSQVLVFLDFLSIRLRTNESCRLPP